MTEPPSIAQVLAADAAFRAAVCSGDLGALDALLAPGFTYIHATGIEDSREEYLARIRGGPVTYVQRDVEKLVVRLHGESAALTGHTAVGFRAGDQPVKVLRSLFLAAWVREGGAWRMVAYCGAPEPA